MGEITKEIIDKYYSIEGSKGKRFPVGYVKCQYMKGADLCGYGEVYTWVPEVDPINGDGHIIIPFSSKDNIKIFVNCASKYIKLPYDWNPKYGLNLIIKKDRVDYITDTGFMIYPEDWRIQLGIRIQELMVPQFLDKCYNIAATMYQCSIGNATEDDVINITKITLDIMREERGE